MSEKIRAALYARVSTEEQAILGYSLDAQLEKMRAFCIVHDYEVAEEYVDDGYSGKAYRNRPAYMHMFSPEESKKWDILIVLKLDRIHRNSKNFMEMMEKLKKSGKDFVSTFEKFNTSTAVGRFALDTIQRIAQLESEQIGERTYLGMREKAQTNGGVMGFTPPIGYGLEDGVRYRIQSQQGRPPHEEGQPLEQIQSGYSSAQSRVRRVHEMGGDQAEAFRRACRHSGGIQPGADDVRL